MSESYIKRALRDPHKPSAEELAAAKAAVDRQRNDTRTEDEKIDDAVRFICDTRLGGP